MSEKKRVTRRSVLVGGAAMSAAALGPRLPAQGSASASLQKLVAGNGKIPVAFVMDNNATTIDFAAAWETFQDASGADVPGFHLYAVAPTLGPYQTTGNMAGSGADMQMSGLKFTPDYTFDNAPMPKVVVMGAQSGMKNPAKIAWIRKVAETADIVMSVCTGVFLLGETGLLDGLEATTHPLFYDMVAKRFPKVKVVRGVRFVDNGKVIATGGGLSSGADGALHVISRYYGPAVAQQVADYLVYQGSEWKS